MEWKRIKYYNNLLDFKTGTFDQNEIDKLMNSLCGYVKEHKLGRKGLEILITENTKA